MRRHIIMGVKLWIGALAAISAGARAQTAPVRLPAPPKPYTMVQVTTTEQRGADGLVVKQAHRTVHVRDSEGRTRLESETESTQSRQEQGRFLVRHVTRTQVSVTDPVAGVSYNWDADPAGPRLVYARSTRLPQAEPPPKPQLHPQTPARDSGGVRGERHPEQLGTRAIQGMIAEGLRETVTFPAGYDGNNVAYSVVQEDWYAPGYPWPLESSSTDPLKGSSDTRLERFEETEPSAELFKPPEGWTIWWPGGQPK